MAYWLVKSEPDVFSIDDLARDGRTGWEGVRNYTARIHLRAMQTGDKVLYYHSNADPTGVAGVAEVVRTAYPDPLQFVKGGEYEDPGSDPADPRWTAVDLAFVEKFPAVVALATLKADKALAAMEVVRKGSRLSVHAVEKKDFDRVVKLGRAAR